MRALLTSVYHGDLGVAGLLLLKHHILLGVKKKYFLEYLGQTSFTKSIDNIYISNVQKAENTTLPILSYSFSFLYFFLALCYLFMS